MERQEMRQLDAQNGQMKMMPRRIYCGGKAENEPMDEGGELWWKIVW
jgi:hypothetical protein